MHSFPKVIDRIQPDIKRSATESDLSDETLTVDIAQEDIMKVQQWHISP